MPPIAKIGQKKTFGEAQYQITVKSADTNAHTTRNCLNSAGSLGASLRNRGLPVLRPYSLVLLHLAANFLGKVGGLGSNVVNNFFNLLACHFFKVLG